MSNKRWAKAKRNEMKENKIENKKKKSEKTRNNRFSSARSLVLPLTGFPAFCHFKWKTFSITCLHSIFIICALPFDSQSSVSVSIPFVHFGSRRSNFKIGSVEEVKCEMRMKRAAKSKKKEKREKYRKNLQPNIISNLVLCASNGTQMDCVKRFNLHHPYWHGTK